MQTLIRCAIIGTIAVAVLAAVFAVLLLAPPRTVGSSIVFVSRGATDIESVFVQNRHGEFSFYFDPYYGGYVVDNIPPYIIDIDVFIDFMINSSNIWATRHIASTNLEDFGLDAPAAVAEITFFDGEVLRLAIGSVEPVSRNFFAYVHGFDGVHVLPKAVAEPFFRPRTHIISRYVTPPLMVSSPLSAIRDITFAGGGLEQPITIWATAGAGEDIALAALSFGAPTHIVQGAGNHQLYQTYGVYIFGSLFGIRAVDIIAYGISDEDVAAFGFDEPYILVEYDMINGADVPMRGMRLMVVEAGDGLYYATVAGSGVIYTINRKPFMDIRYESLLQRWFLTPMLMTLSSVTVESPGMSLRFEIDNTSPLDPIITHNGQEIDVSLFRAFFRLITSASHDGVHLGNLEMPGESALLTIIYEYINPYKLPDTLALFPGGVRRANVFVNGAGEFAMRDLFIERVINAAKSLLDGVTFEVNW